MVKIISVLRSKSSFNAKRKTFLSMIDEVPLLDIHSFGLSHILGTLEIFRVLGYYDRNVNITLRVLLIFSVIWKTKA